MTQKDKDLLFKDLCARLFFGVKVLYNTQIFEVQYIEPMYEETKLLDNENYTLSIDEVKPYLFPLSSMTEEQKKELYKLGWYVEGDKIYSTFRNYDEVNYKTHTDSLELVNWCYKNRIDINGLIEKGLALDATGLNIY